MMTPDPNPPPRLFQFITGDEVDVDRYTALSLREETAHFQLRQGYLRVEFADLEQRDAEIERMRRFRDEPVDVERDAAQFDQIMVGALCASEPQVVLVPPDWSGPASELGPHATTARWSIQRDGDEYLVGLRDDRSENGAILPSLQTARWRVPARAVEMLLVAIGPQRVAERVAGASDAARTGMIGEVQRGPLSVSVNLAAPNPEMVTAIMRPSGPQREDWRAPAIAWLREHADDPKLLDDVTCLCSGTENTTTEAVTIERLIAALTDDAKPLIEVGPRFAFGARVSTGPTLTGTIVAIEDSEYLVELDQLVCGQRFTAVPFTEAHNGGLTAL